MTQPPPEPWAPAFKAPQLGSQQNDDRLNRLEARFDQLEKRQTSFEGRVESKFDHISDSLRQILAASSTRAREVSGETPPPKFSKQG